MKNPAAVALGRLGGLKGGKSTSKRKAAAARKNGQKGGWPKGKRRKGKGMAITIPANTITQVGQRLKITLSTPRKGKGKR